MEDETKRQSLLDVVIEEYNLEKDLRTSRLMLVGQFGSDKTQVEEIQRFHADFVRAFDQPRDRRDRDDRGDGSDKTAARDPRNKITGVCFALNNSVMVHLLEAPTKTLLAYLRLLATMQAVVAQQAAVVAAAAAARAKTDGKDSKTGGANTATGAASTATTTTNSSGTTSTIPGSLAPPGGWLATSSSTTTLSSGGSVASIVGTTGTISAPSRSILKNIRICSLTEEVPREFKIWAWRSFGSKKDDDEEYTPPKDMLKLAFGVLRNFLELGREIQGWSEEKTHDFLTLTASKQLLARVPLGWKLDAMTQSEDMCTPEEYLSIYDRPIDFTLESERVWPVEPFLKY